MAKIIKSCDLSGEVAAKLFVLLNDGNVVYSRVGGRRSLHTDIQPKDLIYPEGWYYAKGCFRNKYESTTGAYDEIEMITLSGDLWGDEATYCTRQ